MDRLKVLKGERTQIRRVFTKVFKEFEDNCAYENIDVNSVKTSLRKLQDKADRLFKLDEEIKNLMFADDSIKEEDLNAEYDAAEDYRDKWLSSQEKVNTVLAQTENPVGSNSCSSERGEFLKPHRNYNLPKLNLLEFDGNVKNWIAFWGQFKKVHNDPDLPAEDKFQYLIQATKPGSSAREMVESFPPAGDNYSKAIEQLKSRFARDEFLIEVYVRELLHLVMQQANCNVRLPLGKLYDRLETQLRALETLGVTSEKYAAMLYPLVESALPDDTLRAWERCRTAHRSKEVSNDQSSPDSSRPINYLQELLGFLRTEVESEERLALARSSFMSTVDNDLVKVGRQLTNSKVKRHEPQPKLPTAATILTTDSPKVASKCLFCKKLGHTIQDCSGFHKLNSNEKSDFIKKKGACFTCLKLGHMTKNCKMFVNCFICHKKHYGIMCRELDAKKLCNDSAKPKTELQDKNKSESLSNANDYSQETLLQTLLVKVTGDKGKTYLARVLLDSGSQRSYITKDCVTKLGLSEFGREVINHSLFGGVSVKDTIHKNYLVTLQSVHTAFKISVPLLDQDIICNYVPRLQNTECFSFLKENNIVLTDVGEQVPEIKILLGADVLGDLFTGVIEKINDKLLAMETYLGWTVMGKQPCKRNQNKSLLSLFCLGRPKPEILDLWSLETIGIKDPVEVKQRDYIDAEVTKHFKENVKPNVDNRYEVCLPWLEGHPELLDNRDVAEKRLMSTTRRLQILNKFFDYDNVFKEWVDLGIIEKVQETAESTSVHYLPHHAVIKQSSLTTKIRPVFDASAKDRRGHSLNECLARGPNLVELIPSLVMKFRKNQFGVTADIKKAFLQISVSLQDRDFLRFVWWEDYAARKLTTFRHCRVVFGISSSPFLLGATINHHLETAPLHLQETANKLKDAFYVDNCITSVDSALELNTFVTESLELMGLGQFDLREWASNYSDDSHNLTQIFSKETVVPLLGMLWDKESDELFCDVRSISMPNKKVTKRDLLSVAQRIFDVVGFTCPVTLLPKLLLQEVWMKKLTWDEVLPDEISDKFSKWVENIHWLECSRIPRRICPLGQLSLETTTVHVFCDSSQIAFAACVFIRTESQNKVAVQLIYAKSRIAPKNATIPRLELLAALIGARMYSHVKEALKLSCKAYFWTDSSIALTWIKEKEDWGTFVGNRCREICKTTNKEDWYHISGDLNPADLPSRGCGAKTLYETKWWEGPAWLRTDESQWPMSNLSLPDSKAYAEKKKTVISAVTTDMNMKFSKTLLYFSSYLKLLRMVAWILRFIHNSNPNLESQHGTLGTDEIRSAEEKVIRCIQQESFEGKSNHQKNLPIFVDDKGLLRVKTRLVLTDDSDDYKYPILLPSNHPIVALIIMEKHIIHQHAGIQTMLVLIREKFWIIKGRKTTRNVLLQCARCNKFKSKAGETPHAPLPLERMADCNAFQSTGIDMAGPLYLRNGDKAWVVLFTCAVYRAVHLELVKSLSTESFISALRRFIARRGRISVIYTDNGTNFTGTNNLLKQLDWNYITEKFAVQRITWKFNPPSAPWWGGFWERLVRMVKELLRRNLGLSSVDYEELMTILCDFESTINSRPLTYVSDDYEALQPLTPSLFLQPIVKSDVQDLDFVDSNSFNKRVKYLQKLRENLRARFKKEYLAMLVHLSKGKQLNRRAINTGDVVLIGDDNIKRVKWPLALVLEMIPGKDGVCRVAKLKTATGELTRPVQRLYPVEINSKEATNIPTKSNDEPTYKEATTIPTKSNDESTIYKEECLKTKCGRNIKIPKKLDL